MKLFLILLALTLSLAACVTNEHISPSAAVLSAAASAPNSVHGIFEVTVKGTGTQDGIVYLNSEEDYRDQRNLTVAINSEAYKQLAMQLGADPQVALKGKRLLVNGNARRVTVNFMLEGKPSGKYYFQTHVNVTNSSQIQVVK